MPYALRSCKALTEPRADAGDRLEVRRLSEPVASWEAERPAALARRRRRRVPTPRGREPGVAVVAWDEQRGNGGADAKWGFG